MMRGLFRRMARRELLAFGVVLAIVGLPCFLVIWLLFFWVNQPLNWRVNFALGTVCPLGIIVFLGIVVIGGVLRARPRMRERWRRWAEGRERDRGKEEH